MRKHLALICLCLLLVSTLVTAFHHHDDGDDHPECSICLAIHHQSDSDYAFPAFEVQRQLVDTVYTQPALAVVTKLFFTPANNRAPPA
jgi:hypothetical protein